VSKTTYFGIGLLVLGGLALIFALVFYLGNAQIAQREQAILKEHPRALCDGCAPASEGNQLMGNISLTFGVIFSSIGVLVMIVGKKREYLKQRGFF
jgi:hypothetical protein